MKMNKKTYMRPDLAVFQLELPTLLDNSVTVDGSGGLNEGGSGSAGNALGRRSDFYGDEE